MGCCGYFNTSMILLQNRSKTCPQTIRGQWLAVNAFTWMKSKAMEIITITFSAVLARQRGSKSICHVNIGVFDKLLVNRRSNCICGGMRISGPKLMVIVLAVCAHQNHLVTTCINMQAHNVSSTRKVPAWSLDTALQRILTPAITNLPIHFGIFVASENFHQRITRMM